MYLMCLNIQSLPNWIDSELHTSYKVMNIRGNQVKKTIKEWLWNKSILKLVHKSVQNNFANLTQYLTIRASLAPICNHFWSAVRRS